MRIALGLEYDGSCFSGWQSQPSHNTVQDTLQSALASLTGHVTVVHAAGRTDTGVHALMQVVHFDTQVNRPLSAWVRGVNSFLPASVRVLWAHQVDEVFHARFSAHARSYQYWLVNSPVAPAIMACHSGWHHASLDVEAMQEACHFFLGEHDFSAFRASECQAKTPIKIMETARADCFGRHVVFSFKANAFLHHQVRNMVGALIYVGKGKHPPEFIKELLNQKDRTKAPPTFSPNGLYLTGVDYSEKFSLPVTTRKLNVLI